MLYTTSRLWTPALCSLLLGALPPRSPLPRLLAITSSLVSRLLPPSTSPTPPTLLFDPSSQHLRLSLLGLPPFLPRRSASCGPRRIFQPLSSHSSTNLSVRTISTRVSPSPPVFVMYCVPLLNLGSFRIQISLPSSLPISPLLGFPNCCPRMRWLIFRASEIPFLRTWRPTS